MPGDSWQVFGSQTPAWVQVPLQFACVVTVQAPAGAQQEPIGGCSHGFGSQTPASVQVPVQAACVVTAQVPAGAQQAPVAQLNARSARLRGLICQPVVYGDVVSYWSPMPVIVNGPTGAAEPSMSVSLSIRIVTGPVPSSMTILASEPNAGQVPLTIDAHRIVKRQLSKGSPAAARVPVVVTPGVGIGLPLDRTVTVMSGVESSVLPL